MADNEARAAQSARQEDFARTAGETWCAECKRVRAVPCRYAWCPLSVRAESFDPLGPVEFVPLVQHPRFNHRTVAEVWAAELRVSMARGRRG